MFKNLIQSVVKFFGYKIIKIEKKVIEQFDDWTKFLINKSQPIVFDVGGGKGQSIKRYKKIFKSPIIHTFEPNIEELNILKKKYENDKNVYLNSKAVSEKIESLELNITGSSSFSSFNKIMPNTDWLTNKKKKYNIDNSDFVVKKIECNTTDLDSYIADNHISNIDVLKIDTQGFENKVLLGAQKSLKKNIIKLIHLELIFSEIYENTLQIFDIEKILIPFNYRLFGISNNGSLMSSISYQSDFIYISNDTYKNYKLRYSYSNN